MGLDISHGDFSISYGGFNALRRKICEAMGGKWPDRCDCDDIWYWGKGYNEENSPGLYEFLTHSDCDGYISPEMCVKVANEIEMLIPNISQHCDERDFRDVATKFVAACREASSANEPLEFY